MTIFSSLFWMSVKKVFPSGACQVLSTIVNYCQLLSTIVNYCLSTIVHLSLNIKATNHCCWCIWKPTEGRYSNVECVAMKVWKVVSNPMSLCALHPLWQAGATATLFVSLASTIVPLIHTLSSCQSHQIDTLLSTSKKVQIEKSANW